jgi:hypothetical protein
MIEVILYQSTSCVGWVRAIGPFTTQEVAQRDLPAGTSYLIVNAEDLPPEVTMEVGFPYLNFWDSLEVDFSTPDGISIGREAWEAENGL